MSAGSGRPVGLAAVPVPNRIEIPVLLGSSERVERRHRVVHAVGVTIRQCPATEVGQAVEAIVRAAGSAGSICMIQLTESCGRGARAEIVLVERIGVLVVAENAKGTGVILFSCSIECGLDTGEPIPATRTANPSTRRIMLPPVASLDGPPEQTHRSLIVPGHATSYHHSSLHCPWARRTHGRRCAFGTTFAQPPSSEKIKNLTRLFPGKTPLPHLLGAQKGSPMRITPGPMGGPTCARTTHPRHRILFCALSVFAAPFFIHHSPPPTGVPFYRTNPISCAILSHDSPSRAAKLSTCPKTQPTGGSPNFRIH
jgi:hypothetical protein